MAKITDHGDGLITYDARTPEEKTIADLQRRNLAHQKGEGEPATCHVCNKSYFYVDDEPIKCPFCGIDGRPE